MKKKCTKCENGLCGMPDFIGTKEICTVSYCDCAAGKKRMAKDMRKKTNKGRRVTAIIWDEFGEYKEASGKA